MWNSIYKNNLHLHSLGSLGGDCGFNILDGILGIASVAEGATRYAKTRRYGSFRRTGGAVPD